MALIRSFDEVASDKDGLHKPVSCGWHVFSSDGKTILQLDTYGSDERKFPNKVSQTIQLDRDGAAALLKLIRDAFPGI